MVDDEILKIKIGKNDFDIKLNKDYKTVKINNLFFNNKSDFYYFVNKLTDIAEDVYDKEEQK